MEALKRVVLPVIIAKPVPAELYHMSVSSWNSVIIQLIILKVLFIMLILCRKKVIDFQNIRRF